MAELKGSQTEKNLLAAFAGESQARNRYTFAAEKAREEGLIQIANIFEETARNEEAHAKRYYMCLMGGEVEITAAYPAGLASHDTKNNLELAIAGEHAECTEIYPGMAKVAREEGFQQPALAFEKITLVEVQHEARYRGLLEAMTSGKLLRKDAPVKWKCDVCGYIHEGTEPPSVCPACLVRNSYFYEAYKW